MHPIAEWKVNWRTSRRCAAFLAKRVADAPGRVTDGLRRICYSKDPGTGNQSIPMESKRCRKRDGFRGDRPDPAGVECPAGLRVPSPERIPDEYLPGPELRAGMGFRQPGSCGPRNPCATPETPFRPAFRHE